MPMQYIYISIIHSFCNIRLESVECSATDWQSSSLWGFLNNSRSIKNTVHRSSAMGHLGRFFKRLCHHKLFRHTWKTIKRANKTRSTFFVDKVFITKDFTAVMQKARNKFRYYSHFKLCVLVYNPSGIQITIHRIKHKPPQSLFVCNRPKIPQSQTLLHCFIWLQTKLFQVFIPSWAKRERMH